MPAASKLNYIISIEHDYTKFEAQTWLVRDSRTKEHMTAKSSMLEHWGSGTIHISKTQSRQQIFTLKRSPKLKEPHQPYVLYHAEKQELDKDDVVTTFEWVQNSNGQPWLLLAEGKWITHSIQRRVVHKQVPDRGPVEPSKDPKKAQSQQEEAEETARLDRKQAHTVVFDISQTKPWDNPVAQLTGFLSKKKKGFHVNAYNWDLKYMRVLDEAEINLVAAIAIAVKRLEGGVRNPGTCWDKY